MRLLWSLLLVSLPSAAQSTDSRRVELDDKMGDGKKLAFYATASERFAGASGGLPTLVIGCRKKRAQFVIAAEVQLQPEYEYGTRSGRIRLDDGQVVKFAGNESNSGDAIHLGDAGGWIRKLSKAKFTLVEVTPFRHGPSAVKFPVAGLDAHAKEIAEHCGVKIVK